MSHRLIDVTLSLDTSAYTAGDVLAETQVVTSGIIGLNGAAELLSVLVIDEDDQGAAFDLYFMSASVSLGTENGTPGITDANARSIVAVVPIATTDYKDLGGVRVAQIKNIGAVLLAAAGTYDIYVGAVNGAGTPTYTASGLKLRLGIREH